MAASCAWAISPSWAARKVNGVSALHGELMKQTVFRTPASPVSRPDHGDHQRRHPAPLAAGFQPRARRPGHRDAGRTRAGSPTWSGCEELAPRASDPAFRARFAAVKQGEQGAARRLHRQAPRAWCCRPRRCSTSRSSASTSTSGSCSTSSRRWRPTPTCVDGAAPPAVPRVKIFAGKAAPSYMRAKLIIKFINDVADGGERRARGRRSAQDPVPAQLQRVAWPRS